MEVNNLIPSFFSYRKNQRAFDSKKAAFMAQDQSKLSADDFDAMDIVVLEINEAFNTYNIAYNNFLDRRTELYPHFKRISHHFLSKHIVREK